MSVALIVIDAAFASSAPAPPDHEVELASDLSAALLVLLERPAPEERAAFLLREVFRYTFGEWYLVGSIDVFVRMVRVLAGFHGSSILLVSLRDSPELFVPHGTTRMIALQLPVEESLVGTLPSKVVSL